MAYTEARGLTDHLKLVRCLPLGGEQVNLESDLIGKYVDRLLQERGQLPAKPTPVVDKDFLQKRGLL